MMEGLIALTVVSVVWFVAVLLLPKLFIALECLVAAWLIGLRVKNIGTVSRMRGGRPPLVVNPRWPLLVATIALAWLIGFQLLTILVGAYREAGMPSPLASVRGAWRVAAFVADAILVLGVTVAPFVVAGCAWSILGETGRWKNSGPRPEPPAPTFGPRPPTGLAPAPLFAGAWPTPEPAFA
jgi:hypothetical protein